jgi:hypothetical protein
MGSEVVAQIRHARPSQARALSAMQPIPGPCPADGGRRTAIVSSGRQATLYVIPGSHACRSAMLMLELKGIAYRTAPLVVGAAVVAGAQDQQLALACGQHASAEQEAAEGEPGPEPIGVAGERGEDVVLAEARIQRGRARLQNRADVVPPLRLGQGRYSWHLRLLRGGWTGSRGYSLRRALLA